MNKQRISNEQLQDIDLDIYNLMKQLPNNDNYNSLYVRWDKENNDTFIRVLCNQTDMTGLLGALIYNGKGIDNKNNQYIEDARFAILNLALHILSDNNPSETETFYDILESIKTKQSDEK